MKSVSRNRSFHFKVVFSIQTHKKKELDLTQMFLSFIC